MKRALTTYAAVLLSSLVPVADSSHGAEADVAPRYKLQPGQEIVYESSYEFKHQGGMLSSADTITFWITAANSNGGWHLIARHESAFTQSFGDSGARKPNVHKEDRIGAFDLLPNGTIENLPSDFHGASLAGPFIELPASLTAAEKGWESTQEPETELIYRLLPVSDLAAGKWAVSETQEGLFNTIYLSNSEKLIHFDASQGLVTASEGTDSQDYGFHGKGTTKLELKSVGTKPKEWIDQLAEEASILGRVRSAVDELTRKNGNRVSSIRDSAKALLEEGRSKVKLPLIGAQFDADLQHLAEGAKYDANDQADEATVLNKPSAEWETTDLDGKPQRLADYRGKVVLLDFWYRGCGWCIRAMPQIKEVVEHYRDKPVAILGMNTDRDARDAQFVVDKLQLNYPTLKAVGLPEKYAVHGFPTLIIIGPDGVVRARHVGYSPTLRDDLIKTIDGLMATGN